MAHELVRDYAELLEQAKAVFERLRQRVETIEEARSAHPAVYDATEDVGFLVILGELDKDIVAPFELDDGSFAKDAFTQVLRCLDDQLDVVKGLLLRDKVRPLTLEDAIQRVNERTFDRFHSFEEVKRAWLMGDLGQPVEDAHTLAELVHEETDLGVFYVDDLGSFFEIVD
jgi:hypothetical protein